MDCTLEKECSALGGLFQSIVNDLKGSHPIWEDFAQKATKLQIQLKATIATVNLFLDALQKIADVATAAKGATRDIGTALTRICMRHRSIENRLKTLTSALIDCLVQPLQEKMEEWRRTALQMDKEHCKEYKRCRNEIKKRSMDTIRLQKKVRKGQSGNHRMLESATQEVNDRYMGLLDIEKQAVRQAMIEQRSEFCLFVSWFKPVLDGEVTLLNEISQLNEVVDLLCKHSADPYTLPAASEAVIMDVKGLENTWRFQTPPSSPGSSLGSRKSSLCSLSSADSHSSIQQQQQAHQQRMIAASNSNAISNNPRFSSMSSQDSGFTSQDTLYITNRPKSPPRSIVLMKQSSVSDEEGSTPGSLDSQQSTPSPSPSSATWPENGNAAIPLIPRLIPPMTPPLQRPHTISAAYSADTSGGGGAGGRAAVTKRLPLSSMTFVPPRPTSLFKHPQDFQDGINGAGGSSAQRPPLPQKSGGGRGSRATTPMKSNASTPSVPKMVPAVPDFNQAHPDQVLPQPIYMNVQDLYNKDNAPTGGQEQHYAVVAQQPLPSNAYNNAGRSKRPLSFVGTDDFIALLNSECQTPLAQSSMSGGSIRDDDEDTVIGECVDQIDLLTSELDRYCTLSTSSSSATLKSVMTSSLSNGCYGNNGAVVPNAFIPVSAISMVEPYCTLPRSYRSAHGKPPIRPVEKSTGCGFSTPMATHSGSTNTIVRRPSTISTSSASGGKPPPPPPTRRNSSITAATPNAPAVDFVRTNSRCTTPVDESFNVSVQQALIVNARYSTPAQSTNVPLTAAYILQKQQSATVVRRPSCPAGPFHAAAHQPQQQTTLSNGRAWSETPLERDVAERYYQNQYFPPPPPPLSENPEQQKSFNVGREILMMQIRNGVPLKTTASNNVKKSPDGRDRSMPRV